MSSREALEVLETQARARLGRALARTSRVLDATRTLLNDVLIRTAERPQHAQWTVTRAVLRLGARLFNDLRAVQMLAESGYSAQAMSVLASVFDASVTIMWIGSDNARAERWFNLGPQENSALPLKSMITDVFGRNPGITDPSKMGADAYFKVYGRASRFKHVHPDSVEHLGVTYGDTGGESIPVGPSGSADAFTLGWSAVHQATKIALLAIGGILRSGTAGDPDERLTDRYERVSQTMLADLKDAERLAAQLQADAAGGLGPNPLSKP